MRRAVIAIYAVALGALAVWSAPLGHDEAQYALGGAALVGRDVSPYPLHRPVGMQLIAAPGVLAGGSDLAFHVIGLALTFAMIAAVYLYARRAHGPRVASWATVVVASSFAVVRRSNELLPDAPAAVLVLAFAGVLIGGLGPGADPNRRWRLVWLGPLAAAAFYVRYGSLGIVGALALAAAIVWRRRLRDNAGPLAAAVVVAAACAVPHVVHSLIATGRPFGILAQASFAAGRAYTGDGLVFYASAWWLWLGPLAAVCALAGLVAAAARRDEVTAFAGLASVLALVALGLDAHGEARFVLVPEVLLVAAGTDAIIARAFPRPKLAAALCAIAFVGAAAATEVGLARERRTFGVAVRAAEVVRGAAGGAPCAVIAGKWTQLEWYSGCAGAVVSDEAIAPAAVAGRAVFLVWYENGVRQPAEVLADLRARRRGVGAAEVARVPGDGGLWGAATVYRLSIGP